jgi:hypothetical protein
MRLRLAKGYVVVEEALVVFKIFRSFFEFKGTVQRDFKLAF